MNTNKFDDYRTTTPVECGPPPHWIVVDWLKEAMELKPNVMFRQRIKEIHQYLDNSIGAMMDQLAQEHESKGVTHEQESASGSTDQAVC